jgi:hypothetical protein
LPHTRPVARSHTEAGYSWIDEQKLGVRALQHNNAPGSSRVAARRAPGVFRLSGPPRCRRKCCP